MPKLLRIRLFLIIAVGLWIFGSGIEGHRSTLSAQETSITGRVIDDVGEGAVGGAEVALTTARGRTIHRVVAGEEGQFAFSVSTGGFYRLEARRIGYRSATSPQFEVPTGGSVSVEIRLDVEAVLLAPLEIVGRSEAAQNPILQGFYERMERGTSGYFFSREEIERRNAFHVADIIRMAPGVRLQSGTRGGGLSVYMSRAPRLAGSCPAQIFVDGILMNRRIASVQRSADGQPVSVEMQEDRDFTIDEVVAPQIIEGIEVYNGISGVPAAFVNQDSRCGVVLIWTRRGI